MDDISYNDIIPDLVLNPVDSVGQHQSSLCEEPIPFPTDSISTVYLDLNQDGINDYSFTYETYYEWVSASSPCANHNSILNVVGLIDGNEICVANEDMDEVSVFQDGDPIDRSQLFANSAVIYRDQAFAFLYFGGFSDEGCIGVKLSSGELGWIKLDFQQNLFLCYIKEFAINKNVLLEIRAGQMQ